MQNETKIALFKVMLFLNFILSFINHMSGKKKKYLKYHNIILMKIFYFRTFRHSQNLLHKIEKKINIF